MPTGRRILARVPLALAVVLVVAASGPALANPAQYLPLAPEYVAIGDSFASGVGTRSYIADGTTCERSPRAYPVLAAARVGAELVFEACSGATTSSVTVDQLGTLGTGTSLVTVMVGGNDAGFSTVISECAKPWWAANCGDRVADAQAFIRATLPGRLDGVYSQVRSLAPQADVTVVGYPRLFIGEDCNAGTWFGPGEQRELNATADLLAAVTKQRALAHGFSFVDARAAFTGHAVCDDVGWINGLSNPVSESYHPNRAGQDGYTDLVDGYLD